MVQRNYNTLLGRYPGADGMKTGFICASGFNLVASATRDGRRLIAVVLGAPSSAARALKAAQLLERGFNSNSGLSWLMPSLGTVETLQPVDAAPPNLRDEMCGPHRKRPATEDEDEVDRRSTTIPTPPYAVFLSEPAPAQGQGRRCLMPDIKLGEPVLVYTGTKPPAPGSPAAGDAKKKAVPPSPRPARTRTRIAPRIRKGCRQERHRDRRRAVWRRDAQAEAQTQAEGPGDRRHVQGRRFHGNRDGAKPKPKPPAPKVSAKDGASPTAAGEPSAMHQRRSQSPRNRRRSPRRRISARRPSKRRKPCRRDDRRCAARPRPASTRHLLGKSGARFP